MNRIILKHIQHVLFVYFIYWRKGRECQRHLDLIIRFKLVNYWWKVYIYFSTSKKFYWNAVIYLTDIFEDNHNIICDHFEIHSVNIMKNRPFVPKTHKEISMYISLIHSHQKTMKIVTRNNNTQNVCKPNWFVGNCWETWRHEKVLA